MSVRWGEEEDTPPQWQEIPFCRDCGTWHPVDECSDGGDGGGLARGLRYGIPISLAVWAGLIALVIWLVTR